MCCRAVYLSIPARISNFPFNPPLLCTPSLRQICPSLHSPFLALAFPMPRPRDFYHTCYTLSGLSVAQHCLKDTPTVVGNSSNLLVSVTTLRFLRKTKQRRIVLWFCFFTLYIEASLSELNGGGGGGHTQQTRTVLARTREPEHGIFQILCGHGGGRIFEFRTFEHVHFPPPFQGASAVSRPRAPLPLPKSLGVAWQRPTNPVYNIAEDKVARAVAYFVTLPSDHASLLAAKRA